MASARQLAAIFACVILVAVIAGIAYEQIGERRDAQRLPRIGKAVDIGGERSTSIARAPARPP